MCSKLDYKKLAKKELLIYPAFQITPKYIDRIERLLHFYEEWLPEHKNKESYEAREIDIDRIYLQKIYDNGYFNEKQKK
jgi:hypothetical protein